MATAARRVSLGRINSEYRSALITSRVRNRRIGAEIDGRLVDVYLDALLRLDLDAASGRITHQRADALRAQFRGLLADFEKSFASLTDSGVSRTIDDVIAQQEAVLARLSSSFDVPIQANFDRVNASVLANMASRRGADTFRSLMKYRLDRNVLPAVDAFLGSAVARGVNTAETTQDLVRIMLNDNPRLLARVEQLPRGFKGARLGIRDVDWSKYGITDGAEIKALRSVYSDARRIAVSETNNALREANTESLVASPVVLAAKWQTSGRHFKEDACDVLAQQDLYGLGEGYYPPEKWPMGPHPHCGCYQGGPIKYREPKDWDKPKAPPPPLKADITKDDFYARYNFTPGRLNSVRQQIVNVVGDVEGLARQIYGGRITAAELIADKELKMTPRQIARRAKRAALRAQRLGQTPPPQPKPIAVGPKPVNQLTLSEAERELKDLIHFPGKLNVAQTKRRIELDKYVREMRKKDLSHIEVPFKPTDVLKEDDAFNAVQKATQEFAESSVERQALLTYQDEYFEPINRQLRGIAQQPENLQDLIGRTTRGLDSAFEKVKPLQSPVEVIRAGPPPPVLNVGDVYRDMGYVSTTTSREIVEDFLKRGDYTYRITIPQGQKVLGVDAAQGLRYSSQNEILLPRGTMFKIRSIDPKTRMVHVEVVKPKLPTPSRPAVTPRPTPPPPAPVVKKTATKKTATKTARGSSLGPPVNTLSLKEAEEDLRRLVSEGKRNPARRKRMKELEAHILKLKGGAAPAPTPPPAAAPVKKTPTKKKVSKKSASKTETISTLGRKIDGVDEDFLIPPRPGDYVDGTLTQTQLDEFSKLLKDLRSRPGISTDPSKLTEDTLEEIYRDIMRIMIGKKDADRYMIVWGSPQAVRIGANGFQVSPKAGQIFGSTIKDPIIVSGQVHFSPETTQRFKAFITEWVKNPNNVGQNTYALNGLRTLVHETFHTLSPMVTNLIENAGYRHEAFRFIEEGLVEHRSRQTILKLFSSHRKEIQDHINRGNIGSYRRETNTVHSLHKRYGSKFVDDVYETGIAENRKNKIVERIYRDVEEVVEKHGGAEALDDLRQNYSNKLLRPGISYWEYLNELIQTMYAIENGVLKVPNLLATIRKMRI